MGPTFESSAHHVIKGQIRTVVLLSAMLLGAFVPQAYVAQGAIRWLIMLMLFPVFLGARFARDAVHPSHLVLVAVNVAVGFAAWGLGALVGGRDVALAGFFAGITPTATAAAVITGFLRGRVEYVIAAFLLTNLVIAALMPVLLPLVLGHPAPHVFADVAGSVASLVFAPMVAAWLLRAFHPPAVAWPRRLANVTFSVWLVSLFLITANASHFVRAQIGLPTDVLGRIALVTAIVCAANFALGHVIGGRRFAREASQSLGQKNTAFTIYLAMTYASPLVALGPTCYIVWHNLWNSWQLHRHRSDDGNR
jgi:BASS family bile acid:Na+ symporter